MKKIVIKRNFDMFLFDKYKIVFGENIFNLKNGDAQIIDLQEGVYTLNVFDAWLQSSKPVEIDENTENIVIRHPIPLWIAFASWSVFVILLNFCLVTMLSSFYLFLWVAVWCVGLSVFSFIRRNHFFKIEVNMQH
jgi:hypothetical protein